MKEDSDAFKILQEEMFGGKAQSADNFKDNEDMENVMKDKDGVEMDEVDFARRFRMILRIKILGKKSGRTGIKLGTLDSEQLEQVIDSLYADENNLSKEGKSVELGAEPFKESNLKKLADPELHLIALDRAYSMRTQKKIYTI